MTLRDYISRQQRKAGRYNTRTVYTKLYGNFLLCFRLANSAVIKRQTSAEVVLLARYASVSTLHLRNLRVEGRVPPSRTIYLYFHVVSGKIWQNNKLIVPLGAGVPPLGNLDLGLYSKATIHEIKYWKTSSQQIFIVHWVLLRIRGENWHHPMINYPYLALADFVSQWTCWPRTMCPRDQRL